MSRIETLAHRPLAAFSEPLQPSKTTLVAEPRLPPSKPSRRPIAPRYVAIAGRDSPVFAGVPDVDKVVASLGCARFGLITLPANRLAPSAAAVQLPVIVLKALTPEGKRQPPLVCLNGGPGTPSTALYDAFAEGGSWRELRKVRDIVLIGERGTEGSTPAIDPRGASELAKTVFGAGEEAHQVSDAETRALVARTHAELTSEGVDLSTFNLRELAADVHDTMKALGYRMFDIYGVSFGTLFAQAVAKTYPRDVRALVLDSPAMPDHNPMLEVGRTAQRALDAVFAKADKRYPGIATTFYGLIDTLNAKPHAFTHQHEGRPYRVSLTGDDLFAIAMGLMSDKKVLDLPRAIRAVATGDMKSLEAQRVALLAPAPEHGTYCSVMGSLFPAPESAVDTRGLSPVVARVIGGKQRDVLRTFAAWPVEAAQKSDPDAHTPLKRKLPTLVLPAQFDSNIAPELGAKIAANTGGYLVTVPGSAHVTIDSPGVIPLIAEFLSYPRREPLGAEAIRSRQVAFH